MATAAEVERERLEAAMLAEAEQFRAAQDAYVAFVDENWPDEAVEPPTEPPPTEPPTEPPTGKPWLSREAMLDLTGPRGTLPAVRQGAISTTKDGQVIEGVRCGVISVRHKGVTIRDFNSDAAGAAYNIAFTTTQNAADCTIEHGECVNAKSAMIPPYQRGTVVRNMNIHALLSDGIKPGSDTVVEDTYIWGMTPGEGAHADAFQARAGTGIQLRRCRIEGPWQRSNAAIFWQGSAPGTTGDAGLGPNVNNLWEDCLVSGGNYSFWCGMYVEGIARRITFHGYNTMPGSPSKSPRDARNSWAYGPRSGNAKIRFEQCTYLDGKPV